MPRWIHRGQSDRAALAVSQSNTPIYLSAAGLNSNSFQFSLSGDDGRNYRIESSTDLVDWTNEASFLQAPFWPDTTSIIFNSSSPTALCVTNGGTNKFLRATPYLPVDQDAEICINHLREIRVAKLLWQRDLMTIDSVEYPSTFFGLVPTLATPQTSDLLPYFPQGVGPFCPDDETEAFEDSYSLGALLTDPTCLIHPDTHLLEDPR